MCNPALEEREYPEWILSRVQRFKEWYGERTRIEVMRLAERIQFDPPSPLPAPESKDA